MSAGWYPDPTGRFEFRYHNGRSWTGDVATGGERYVDHGAPAWPSSPSSPGSPAAGAERRNPLATAALVCGVVGLTICWLPVLFVAGTVLGVLGVVFGVVGRRRSRSAGGTGHGFATAGLLTGGFAIAGSVGGLALTSITLGALDRYENPPPSTVTFDRCDLADGRVEVTGRLRNDDPPGEGTADFTVLFEVRRDDGRALVRARRAVSDVAPGDSATFEVTERVRGDGEVVCEVLDVTGPLPFGIAP